MDIKTKFDVGQKVYYEQKGEIKEGVIKRITINFDGNYNKISYKFFNDWYNEEELYATKEEVKKIVIDRIMDL